MKIVVTGGCGFIGSSFVNYVYENHKYFEIVVVDKLTYASDIGLIPYSVNVITKDINELTLDEINDADYIVNFAAETHVDNSIADGSPFIQSNIVGTFHLLELARKVSNLKKFVQISTDEVYGDLYGTSEYEASENHIINPSSYYSASKSAADGLVLSANRTYGLPVLITRTCNNFGKNQNEEKFIPKIIKSIKENKDIPIYGNGNQIREWIWVEDNVKAIFNLMLHDVGVWNVGSGDRYSNIFIISMIQKIIGNDIKFKFVEDRLGHDKKYSLNSDKLIYKYSDKFITKNLKEFLTETLRK
jgi:dTDP-glucose 4,6-dehydratase